MRFDHNGVSLWFATHDAPAPVGNVKATSGSVAAALSVTIAVQPIGTRYSVALQYRVNGGGTAKIPASLLRTDVSAHAQYFHATFPDFHVGDSVQYAAVVNWPGGQVPDAATVAAFPASFKIVSKEAPAFTSPPPAGGTNASAAPNAPPATGATAGKGPYKVQGYIFYEYGLPATGVVIRIYNRGFGASLTKLGEITTDVNGYYSIAYDAKPGLLNLEARAVDMHGVEVPLCDTKHDAQPAEIINLVAPTSLRPVQPEFARISADLSKEIGDLAKLASAREDQEQKDLTILAASTGWDARLIGLVAQTTTMAKQTGVAADVIYGLLRAGLPTQKDLLARVQIDQFDSALSKAANADILKLDPAHAAAAKTAFHKFALSALRGISTPGVVSSYDEMLAKSGLTAQQQAAFAELYFAQGLDSEGLWEKVAAIGIPPVKIAVLKLQGQLFYLTMNNATLALALQHEIGTAANLAKLVDADLHKPEPWKARLHKIAGNNDHALAALIPSTYGGTKTADRLEAYAADMARRVRMSYPTHVTARMLESSELSTPGRPHAAAASAAKFIKAAADLGYRLGETPAEKFLAQHKPALTAGLKDTEIQDAIAHLKQLHRLHQITPSDESLQALLAVGLASAHDVAKIPFEDFIARFGHTFPPNEAELVYRKAQQVHSTTMGFSSMAKSAASSTGAFAFSPPPQRKQESKNNLIEQYPSMATLFGSMDFCPCEECRSVLGPAAYLVDILQFIDLRGCHWQQFITEWKKDHADTPYPFQNHDQMQRYLAAYKQNKGNKEPLRLEINPYEVLIERRPDLPNLPLTCENTNTVMPYIDIVNEILEYFVAHDALSPTSGQDTGSAKTQELLAEPQHILPRAYDTLRSTNYPLSLPFDLWHETVRRFLMSYDSSLTEVLDAFRRTDDLFPAYTGSNNYARAGIFIEALGLSRAEYDLFTQSPQAHWFGLYGYESEAQALHELSSAKALADSLEITYLELASILETGFVNPALSRMVVLRNLGVGVDELIALEQTQPSSAISKEQTADFHQRLAQRAAIFNASAADARIWLDNAWKSDDFARILILASPPDGTCNFSQTTLRYAKGGPAEPIVFLRINLFVRLWRKLRWPMEEIDRALQALLPASGQPLTVGNIGDAFKTGLIYLSHLKHLEERLPLGKHGRLKLLTLWSNLSTTGNNPLYAQLFLTPSILKTDPVFDDPQGNYFATLKTPEPLSKHLLAIQAALGLTSKDIQSVLADSGQDPTTALLTMENLSLLYRHGLLAKALKLSVDDLIVLKALSGLDPFTPLQPDPITQIADDHPFSQTIAFVDAAHTIKESGFHVEDLNYLFRHQFDPVGKYSKDAATFLVLARSLATGLRSIQSDQAIPTASSALTDEVLQTKLALVLPPDAVSTFMGIWAGTVQFQVSVPGILPANKLDPTAYASLTQFTLHYDDVLPSQGLASTGPLTDAQYTQLIAQHPAPLFVSLLGKVVATQNAFHDKYLSGFLSPADFQQVMTPSTHRAKALAQKLYPFVQQQLSREFAIATLTTSLNADPDLVRTLSLHPNPQIPPLLSDPAQPGIALADAFDGVAQNQLDVTGLPASDKAPSTPHMEGFLEVPVAGPWRFFAQADTAGTHAVLSIDPFTDPVFDQLVSTDGGNASGMVQLKSATLYPLSFDGSTSFGHINLLAEGEHFPQDSISKLTLYSKSAIDKAHRVRTLLAKSLQLIEKFSLNEREVRYLLAEPNATDFGGLNFSQLPASASDFTPALATSLFQQFLRLARYVRLREEIAAGGDDLIGIYENAKRTYSPAPTPPATPPAATAPSTPTDASTPSPATPLSPPDLLADVSRRLADLTRRDVDTVRGAMQVLGFTVTSAAAPSGRGTLQTLPQIRREQGLEKLWRVLKLAEKVGVSPQAIARWATPSPDAEVARDLRNTVKAQYEPDEWLAIAQPIFDKLRRMQRDALVSLIMHRNGFTSKDQLFEYFLVDPGMEPIVQTSRLRLAMSSVQTFIQRCFLGLEPRVQSTALDSEQWQWIKRYRVWQANREIFIHPENYMEMEFRDDKTDLFAELEGTLLQNDITNDVAEDALFTYLQKLEEISNLEIVSMCCQENPTDPDANVIHVIAASHAPPRKFFYRTFANQMWTAWQPISTSIDGEHVVAAWWRDRLNVFWLSFIHQANTEDADSSSDPSSQDDSDHEPKLADTKLSDMLKKSRPGLPPKKIQVQLNWAEHYQGKWSTPSTSGGSDDSDDESAAGTVGKPVPVTVEFDFDPSQVSVHGIIDSKSQPQAAYIHVTFPRAQYIAHLPVPHLEKTRGKPKISFRDLSIAEWKPKTFAFKIVSKYTPPTIVDANAQADPPFPALTSAGTHYQGTRSFQVQYVEKIEIVDGQAPNITFSRQEILRKHGQDAGNRHWLTVLGSPLAAETPEIGTLISPLFFADRKHTFFVEPTLTETSIDTWEHWAIPVPDAAGHGDSRGPAIVAAFPQYRAPRSLPKNVKPFSGTFDPGARFKINVPTDTTTHPASVLHFGGSNVGNAGATAASKPRPAGKAVPKAAPPKGGHK